MDLEERDAATSEPVTNNARAADAELSHKAPPAAWEAIVWREDDMAFSFYFNQL